MVGIVILLIKYMFHFDFWYTDDALASNIRSLMMAGTETTTDTLLWAVIYMLHNPHIQNRIHKELDEVVGADRTPSWNDRSRMPYTEATICELQRIINHVPLSLPHRYAEVAKVYFTNFQTLF